MSALGASQDHPLFISRHDELLPGVRRVVNVPNPAAGADWSAKVPSGVSWRVLTGVAVFTASANVANRQPGLAFTTSDGEIFRTPDGGAIVAGVVANYSYVTDGILSQQVASGLWSEVPLPNLWLPSQTVLGSSTTAINVTDQWSAIALYVEELYATDQELSEWYERKLEANRATS